MGLKETEERYYLLVKEPKRFREASVNCKLRGGTLAMPKTSNTNRLMADYVSQAGLTRVYIGVQANSEDTVSVYTHTEKSRVSHFWPLRCCCLKQNVYAGSNSSETWLIPEDLFLWKVLLEENFCVFVIRREQPRIFMQTPALCRGLQLGDQKMICIPEYLPLPTQAVWSCSVPEHGAMWSAKPQCFSSVSSQRAGEEEMEEEEEGHLLLCHHKSKESSIIWYIYVIEKRLNKLLNWFS